MTEYELRKKKAEERYLQILEEDKNKDFMDLLPKDFKTFKRSLVKKRYLVCLDRVLELLNSSTFFDGKVFTKKDLVRYTLLYFSDEPREVAHKFIPHVSSFSLEDDYLERENIQTNLCWMTDHYKTYLEVKEGVEIDWEPDGFPRTGRGNICIAFTPIDGYFPKKVPCDFPLYNPRSKKDVIYKLEEYKAEDNIYKAKNEKGEIVFLISLEDVEEAWDCLFSLNKEIFGGWWNKKLISKLVK